MGDLADRYEQALAADDGARLQGAVDVMHTEWVRLGRPGPVRFLATLDDMERVALRLGPRPTGLEPADAKEWRLAARSA